MNFVIVSEVSLPNLVNIVSQSLASDTMCQTNSTECLPAEVKKSAEEDMIVVSDFYSPPVYFNYMCYSASFLSKARLASLPKQVGKRLKRK